MEDNIDIPVPDFTFGEFPPNHQNILGTIWAGVAACIQLNIVSVGGLITFKRAHDYHTTCLLAFSID
jgi:hypothetical protein